MDKFPPSLQIPYHGLFFKFRCHPPTTLPILSLTVCPPLSPFPSASVSPDSNRLRCPGTTPLRSYQAWVMRRVIGPLPPEQGQSFGGHDWSWQGHNGSLVSEGCHGCTWTPRGNTLSPNSAVLKQLDTHTHTHTHTYTHVCTHMDTMQGWRRTQRHQWTNVGKVRGCACVHV